MSARLTSEMLASALIRRVGQGGGNATVISKGDATAGGMLLVCADRGTITSVQERILDINGQYRWTRVGLDFLENVVETDAYLARRRSKDCDLWVLELDIANAERFAAETISHD